MQLFHADDESQDLSDERDDILKKAFALLIASAPRSFYVCVRNLKQRTSAGGAKRNIISKIMAGQGLKYNVDIVMCIDCTGSMGDLLTTVKTNALKFYPDLKARCDAKGKEISELRIRVIGFRDFYADEANAIQDSGFYNIPDQESEFKSFVNGLQPTGGGDEPENGLEALAMAINSDWTTGGDKRRHVVVVWSDASTHPVGLDKCKNEFYPQDMPKDFDELTDWWNLRQGGRMNFNAERLIIFAPDASAWTEIGINWENTIHHTAKAGMGLTEVDYETIMAAIVESV